MADIVTNPITFTGTEEIDLSTANFTPGAALAIDASMQIINAAWNKGIDEQAAFAAKMAAIGTWLDPSLPPTMSASSSAVPSITEPTVLIPSTVDVTDVMDMFDTKYGELVTLLSDKFVAFRTAYFPDEQNAYVAAEDWLQAAIADPTGLPASVRAALVNADKDIATAEATRAIEAVMRNFAARRFPMPPGAAAGATLQIQQKAQDIVAESSRKMLQQSIEQLRFVTEKTLNLRQIAMDEAIKYITALASGPNIASGLVNVGYDAQSKLISAASSFYGARSEAAKVVSQANQFNATATQDAASKNLQSELTIIEDKLKALLAEAAALAQMATSLFNNVHASSGSSYSVSA